MWCYIAAGVVTQYMCSAIGAVAKRTEAKRAPSARPKQLLAARGSM